MSHPADPDKRINGPLNQGQIHGGMMRKTLYQSPRSAPNASVSHLILLCLDLDRIRQLLRICAATRIEAKYIDPQFKKANVGPVLWGGYTEIESKASPLEKGKQTDSEENKMVDEFLRRCAVNPANAQDYLQQLSNEASANLKMLNELQAEAKRSQEEFIQWTDDLGMSLTLVKNFSEMTLTVGTLLLPQPVRWVGDAISIGENTIVTIVDNWDQGRLATVLALVKLADVEGAKYRAELKVTAEYGPIAGERVSYFFAGESLYQNAMAIQKARKLYGF